MVEGIRLASMVNKERNRHDILILINYLRRRVPDTELHDEDQKTHSTCACTAGSVKLTGDLSDSGMEPVLEGNGAFYLHNGLPFSRD